MILYHLPKSSINIELTILSGGLVETGKVPTVTIRNKDTGNYFDFASRTFTSTTVSATALLTSGSTDGLYTFPWDITNLFNNDIYLTFEYTDFVDQPDIPAFTTDDIALTTKPSGGGVGPIVVKGQWTAKQKKQALDGIENIENMLQEFRRDAMIMLRKILNKKTVEKQDIEFLNSMKERDTFMWGEMLKILEMRNDATTKEVVEKLSDYLKKEEEDKKKVLELLDKKLREKEPPVDNEDEE